MSFNQLDLIFIIVLALAVIRGTIRGFVNEFCSMAALILGFVAAIFLSKPLGELITQLFGPSLWSQVIAFLVLFLVVYLIIKLLEGAIEKGVKRLNLEKLDQVMGFFLGMVEGGLVGCLILIVTQFAAEHIQPLAFLRPVIEGSFFADLFLPVIAPAAQSILK